MLSQTVKDYFVKSHGKDTKSNPFKLGMTMKRTNAIMAGSSSSEAFFLGSACSKMLPLFAYWICWQFGPLMTVM
jgi:hypothetical protein